MGLKYVIEAESKIVKFLEAYVTLMFLCRFLHFLPEANIRSVVARLPALRLVTETQI